MSALPPVGQSVVRLDGRAKVTGAAQYVDDVRPDGCLYGATVRSARAHARVISVEQDPAFDWTDIVFATARDIPGKNHVHLITDDQPCLADGIVRHVEEPVALVAAPTRDRALAAARAVRVAYEDLEPMFDAESADGNPNRIWGEDNVFRRLEIHKGGRAGEGILHEGVYRTGLQEQLYIEPQGMIAVPEPDGRLTIFGSMQCPYYVVKALDPIFGAGRVRVVQAATGGGFGGKEEYPSMVAAHAALLAITSGRPVKLVYRRDEDLRATTKRHPVVVRIRSRTAPDGTLLEWDADFLIDGGAYNTLSPVVLSRGLIHLTGPYRCPNVHLRGKAVATTTPPNGAFRGFGAPQAMWAAERHMDRIARSLSIDPLDLRRHNLVRDGDTTATGQVLKDTGGFAVLESALEAAAEPVPVARPHAGAGSPTWSRGRGVALVFHGCGFTGNGESWLRGRAAVELVGREIRIHMASTDIGQGTDTVFPQIVAAELGIDVARVSNAPHDTATAPDSGPTVASRTTMVVGGVVLECARKLRAALRAETGLATDDFDALLAARRTTAPLRVEHQYEDDGTLKWDDATYQGDAYPTFGWNCTVVDVDVDRDTGEVLYRRMVTSTDVGRAVNPVLCTGQIEGGALQALGWATAEEVVLTSQGGMKNDRLTTYIIPTALDAPEMVTRLVEIPYRGGPFGAKGVGEIPMDGPAAAVAQAIEVATGAVLDSLPMTPERVLAALPVDDARQVEES